MQSGAYGGKREVMDMVSPVGPVYQAGTLSGNPIATTAGIATLTILKEDKKLYKELEEKAIMIAEAVRKAAGDLVCVNQIGSLISVFFTNQNVVNYETALSSDTMEYSKYFSYLLDHGIYAAPAQFEALFVSAAHSIEDIEETCRVAASYFEQ